MARNERGSIVLESALAAILFFTFVAGLLLVAYFQFGRAWVQYRSEQTLYCLAEGEPQPRCKRTLKTKLEQFLPWGTWAIRLEQQNSNWVVEVKWIYEKYTFSFKKELNANLLVARKASRL